MKHFNQHSIESAPEKSKGLLTIAKQTYGFLPNLLATMAESPAILEGYMTLAGIFNKTKLSETERQIILMTSNRLNGCSYCMAAHTTISQMSQVPNDVIVSLRENKSIADKKLEALRLFTVHIVENRGWATSSEVENFLAAGYTRENILDVILGTSLKVMSNYTNHLAETPLDAAFEPNVWKSK